MDVAGAFDTVSHQRLTHTLRKRKIPKWITDWLSSFLNDRNTTLAINRKATGRFAVRTGIPQGSILSSILYLFYNADLYEICERPGTNTSAIGFVDDANILAYGKSTEENCKTLESIHRQCEKWASDTDPYSLRRSTNSFTCLEIPKDSIWLHPSTLQAPKLNLKRTLES